jgi:dihydroorotate dehydrogenase
MAALERMHGLGLARFVCPQLEDDPVELMGLRFPNPVGLAAGLDKDAAHVAALASLGFGSIEVGTVTPLAQPGNVPPRLFRLPQAQAIINRMGFNNQGVASLATRLSHRPKATIVGVNIGRNAQTPNANALDDYVACLRAVYTLADYVTINVSSPNTRDLRSLQSSDELSRLLAGIDSARAALTDQSGHRLPRLADVVMAHNMDAILATNTTLSRVSVQGVCHAAEGGGLSGAPLRDRSTEVVRRLATHVAGHLPVIAAGGILNGHDAVEKLSAGASMVQLYTGLIYRGPALIAECRTHIRRFSRL